MKIRQLLFYTGNERITVLGWRLLPWRFEVYILLTYILLVVIHNQAYSTFKSRQDIVDGKLSIRLWF